MSLIFKMIIIVLIQDHNGIRWGEGLFPRILPRDNFLKIKRRQTSSHLFLFILSTLLASFHLYSSLFTSTHLFSPLLTSTYLQSPLPTSSHLFPPLPTSSQNFLAVSIPSHLFSPLYTFSHLFSSLFFSSQNCSLYVARSTSSTGSVYQKEQ